VRTLEVKRLRRATRSVSSLNRWIKVADSSVEQNPEGVSNAMRGVALETAYGYAGGRKLWRVTPKADLA